VEQIVKEILALEWAMMGSMDSGENSEEERPVFEAMRRAQFDTWPEELAASYLADLKAAEAAGRNLQNEKFTRMLRYIAPEEYAQQLPTLPAVSAEKQAAVDEIWAMLRELNRAFSEKYPVLGMSGRPLNAEQETDIPSIETYQCSEMLTYSEETLGLFKAFLAADVAAGNNLVEKIQENTIRCMGFASLDDAEKQLAWQALQEMGGQACTSCGMTPAF